MNISDNDPECPGLANALEKARIVIPYPDYTGVIVWYGGTTVSILNAMGCTIDIHEVGTISEPEVRERMESFMAQVTERFDSEQSETDLDSN